MKTIKRSQLLLKLGPFQSVSNTSSRNGYGKAPNQFELRFQYGEAFQSYNSLIAVRYNGEWFFTRLHDYSATTSRHLSSYCGIGTKERREGLESGKYTLIVD